MLGIKKDTDGVVNFPFCFPADCKIPWVDIEADTGPIVVAAINDRQKWLGKRIPIYGEMLTGPQTAEAYQRGRWSSYPICTNSS